MNDNQAARPHPTTEQLDELSQEMNSNIREATKPQTAFVFDLLQKLPEDERLSPEGRAALSGELRNAIVAPPLAIAASIAVGSGMTLHDFLFLVGAGWDGAQRKHAHLMAQRALSNLQTNSE